MGGAAAVLGAHRIDSKAKNYRYSLIAIIRRPRKLCRCQGCKTWRIVIGSYAGKTIENYSTDAEDA